MLDQGSPWDTVATNEIGNDHGQMTVSWAMFLHRMKLFIFTTSSFWKDIILIRSDHVTVG